jgi:uncharacterized membrane protein YfcA
MFEAGEAALAIPGVGWVFVAAFVAGIVRGFSGFGTGMIFLPVASQFIAPVWAIMIVMVMDMIGPVPAIPAALRNGHPRDLMRLLAGTVVALPLGLLVLFWVDPAVFRLGVSVVSLAMLAVLMAGMRYHGALTPRLVYATGGLAGLLGGAVGIPGPPVVLFYMASPHPARVIRANIMAYLFFFDLMMIAGVTMAGRLSAQPLVLGLMAALPYLAGNMTGWWIFRPELEKLYRGMAYVIIAVSALSGLKSVVLG